MKESFAFKKETKEDIRKMVERDVRKIEHEVGELRYRLNEILSKIDAQNGRAQEDYRRDPSKDVDVQILSNLVDLQKQREKLEDTIEKKEGELGQLRGALNK